MVLAKRGMGLTLVEAGRSLAPLSIRKSRPGHSGFRGQDPGGTQMPVATTIGAYPKPEFLAIGDWFDANADGPDNA